MPITLLPDHKQAIRLGNSLLAAAGGLVLTVLLVYGQAVGDSQLSTQWLWISLGIFWLVNLVVLSLIITGRNREFSDPSMTLPQMYWAAISSLFIYNSLNELREMVLLFLYLITLFGTFRLSTRSFFTYVLAVIAVFTLDQIAYFLRQDHHHRASDQIMVWLVFVFGNMALLRINNSMIRLRQRLREKNTDLENALNAKSIFLANMSHELRTPLNGVIGMASLLRESQLSDEQKRITDVITTSSKNLLEVINNILDFSKLEAGQINLVEQEFSLQKLMQEIVQITSENARAKGLEFRLEIDSKLPKALIGDAFHIKQVVLNLISNANKFTQMGFIKLSLKVDSESHTHVNVRFQVVDTGIGIARSQQQHIFAEFSQEDSSTTRQYGGTGLGLAISSQIVKAMGGEIKLTSSKGQGSTFWFNLALKRPITQLMRMGEDDTGQNRPKFKHFEAYVLVVDDDRTNQIVTSQILKHLGCELKIAKNGVEAVACCQNEKFDLVFMDCQMPIMDGYMATQKIRGTQNPNRSTPIIALTANALVDDSQKCLQAGMDAHLPKPTELTRIAETLEIFLN